VRFDFREHAYEVDTLDQAISVGSAFANLYKYAYYILLEDPSSKRKTVNVAAETQIATPPHKLTKEVTKKK
jgi:hypothetical protein